MRKIISCILVATLMLLCFSGCDTKTTKNHETNKLKIVATIFPAYDWTKEILGDHLEKAELTLLLKNGMDMHSYQPTVEDMVLISTCDMFIYVGGASDTWVEDALENATNQDMVVINLLEVLGDAVKEEEIIEGMAHDHDHAHAFDPAEVENRPLSDWKGRFTSIEKHLEEGALDGYAESLAQENGIDISAQKEKLTAKWKSNYKQLEITETEIVFDGTTAKYEYLGHRILEGEHGASVWYGYTAVSNAPNIPAYIAFSDHAIKSTAQETQDTPMHFHFRYGNESFEALLKIEDWAPTYFAAEASGAEVAHAMEGHSHDHEGEADEHVWLSLRHAQTITSYIAEKLGEMDAVHAGQYLANAVRYNKKLEALDTQYEDAIVAGQYDTILFGDRFPFRYLVDDYDLAYYAAFSGCSAETEASFDTIIFLADKVDALRLNHILIIETSDGSIAKTVIENTKNKNGKILVLDSLQAVTQEQMLEGASYLSIMTKNLDVLKEALAA